MTKKSNTNTTNAGSNRAVSRPPSSPGAADVKPYGSYLEFKNNVPVARYNPPPDGLMTKQTMQSKQVQMMSEPFTGTVRDPVTYEEIKLNMPHMIGRPMGEVLLAVFRDKALLGDQKAFDSIMDRTYGKPVQESHNLNANVEAKTIREWLDEMEIDGVVDVQATVKTQQDDDDLDALLEDF